MSKALISVKVVTNKSIDRFWETDIGAVDHSIATIPFEIHSSGLVRIVLTLVRIEDVCVRLASVFLLYKRSINVILFASFR